MPDCSACVSDAIWRISMALVPTIPFEILLLIVAPAGLKLEVSCAARTCLLWLLVQQALLQSAVQSDRLDEWLTRLLRKLRASLIRLNAALCLQLDRCHMSLKENSVMPGAGMPGNAHWHCHQIDPGWKTQLGGETCHQGFSL